jgi:hypothetical protein
MIQTYRTAAAFKQALEQRLRTASASGIDFGTRVCAFGPNAPSPARSEAPRVHDAARLPNSRVKDLPDIALIATAGLSENGHTASPRPSMIRVTSMSGRFPHT